jgi:hypothetical protein
MDYAPTLKALAEKRFELDLEGETISKLKAAMQEQLHRLQIEERQLVKQLEGDPAAGTEWMLRTFGGSALTQGQHASSIAAVAGQQPAGSGAAVATPGGAGPGQSASRYSHPGDGTGPNSQTCTDTLAAATSAAAAAAADDDDDDDDSDDMDDTDDDTDDDDTEDDMDDGDADALRAELMKLQQELMNSR